MYNTTTYNLSACVMTGQNITVLNRVLFIKNSGIVLGNTIIDTKVGGQRKLGYVSSFFHSLVNGITLTKQFTCPISCDFFFLI